MINISAETLIPVVPDACKIVPPARGGKRTHASTIMRWILRGALSPSGERIKLEAIRMGNRWMTSREALQRFAERLTPPTDTTATSSPQLQTPRTPTARRRSSEREARELDRIGI